LDSWLFFRKKFLRKWFVLASPNLDGAGQISDFMNTVRKNKMGEEIKEHDNNYEHQTRPYTNFSCSKQNT
jgi:hypothetical protein